METLVWGWNHMPKSIIFGKLVELALPVVKSYHSDLFHDAMWINDLQDRPTEFYYTVRESGTWISDVLYNPSGSLDVVYRIKIEHNIEDDSWAFGAEKV